MKQKINNKVNKDTTVITKCKFKQMFLDMELNNSANHYLLDARFDYEVVLFFYVTILLKFTP